MPRAAAAAGLLWALSSAPALAQEAPPATLDRIEEWTREGRTGEARGALLGWWTETYPDASRRDVQQALWLRGRLTVDPAQAAIDYRRLVVEFPGGPYSDLALFRLAQGAFAAGDSAAAAAHVGRLVREYPSSPVLREAETWLAGAGSPPLATAPDRPGAGEEEPGGADADPSGGREAPPREASPYAVQLGAFAEPARAEALRARVAGAGFDARLARLPGSDLVRVRVGALVAEDDARTILRRLQELGFTAALVKDAHLEERAGR